ncbi:hypothetical protein, partial [Photobacterium phosphoreum]|uniref:hypothetical protein n=1 Tax=Photobacterium phosphoreum TaxID=659 RepID=UPI000D4EC10D
SSQLLKKQVENIEMKKDFNELIDKLNTNVQAVSGKTKDSGLNRDLDNSLESLNNKLAENTDKITSVQKADITVILNSIDILISEKNRFGKRFRENLIKTAQEIKNQLCNLDLNDVKAKVKSVDKKQVQEKQNVAPLIEMESKENITTNKKIDDDKNRLDVLMKDLVSKLDVMGKDVLDLTSKSSHELSNKIDENKSRLDLLMKSLESNSDLTSKSRCELFNKITGVDSSVKSEIKDELYKVSKLIPKDVLKKDDFTFELNNKFRELDSLKEVVEDLESLPASNKHIKAQLTNINDKLDNISVQSASKQESVKVPDEIQAVEDLAKYMRDGVEQFENMSRLYVSKISEFEKVEQIKEQHQDELLKVEKESADQGKLEAKLSLAKEIAETFPSEFKAIKSIFKSVITERYIIGEIINVTNENKNEMMPYFSMELELVEYEIISPALLIGDDIVFKAEIKKVSQLVNETTSVDEIPELKADAVPEVNADATPELKADAVPEVNADATPELKADAVPEVSEDATPEIKADALPDVSVDTTPEMIAGDTSKFVAKED